MNSRGLKPGDTCGDYRVMGLLGAGGMGAVYKVEHLITRRIEAMKVLAPDLTGDADDSYQFLREIQLQAHLHHPNIAAVYNAFREGEQAVLVMEFVEGESLKARLDRGPIPLGKGVNLVAQVLSALSHAHAEGVIHRDVTPGNVIVTPDGTVKLTDFGLAKTNSELCAAHQGEPVGSLWYMSPEQVTGNSVMDCRTDIYSTGAMLYEVLTGKKLFDLEAAFSVMRAHVEAVPAPPSVRNRRVPPAFDSIVMRALAKQPHARFQSADDFRKALEGVDLRAQRSRRSRFALAVAFAAAGVVEGACLIHFLPALTRVEAARKPPPPKRAGVRSARPPARTAKPVIQLAPPAPVEPPPTGIRVTGGEVEEPSPVAPPQRRLTCPTPNKAEPAPTPAAPGLEPTAKSETPSAPARTGNRVLHVLRNLVSGAEP